MTLILSRRDVCFAGAGFLMIGVGSGASQVAQATTPTGLTPNMSGGSDYLALRGARAGHQAMLRATGTVCLEGHGEAPQPAWALEENTFVSWHMDGAGSLIERREGRLTLRPLAEWGPRQDIEIATGPVAEPLFFDAERIVMAASPRRYVLIMATQSLPRDEAWQIADQPDDVRLPDAVSALRVFATSSDGAIGVTWAMRSPWLSQMGSPPSEARLLWHARGQLAAWQAGAPAV